MVVPPGHETERVRNLSGGGATAPPFPPSESKCKSVVRNLGWLGATQFIRKKEPASSLVREAAGRTQLQLAVLTLGPPVRT
jgi:hypothetical protein